MDLMNMFPLDQRDHSHFWEVTSHSNDGTIPEEASSFLALVNFIFTMEHKVFSLWLKDPIRKTEG
jgi:hypothetical protein